MIDLQRVPALTFVSECGRDDDFNIRERWSSVAALAEQIAKAFPDAERIGVLFPSCPELIVSWLAVLVAGKEPVVPEFPTEKLSAERWTASISSTVNLAAIDAFVCQPAVAQTFALPRRHIAVDSIDDLGAPGAAAPPATLDGAFLQLSSGTTGHRKAVRFTLTQVATHVAQYSRHILSGGDVIASWLPLSHDMGFIACFLLPLMTGTPVVMMDPIAWTKRPSLLFDAIERHEATICYMPNFGFRRMLNEPARRLPSMRHWVSCSEPVYAETMEAFGAHVGAPLSALDGCYAMAENVFAVTHSDGLCVSEANGERRVACGFPIDGCEVKVVDGEIWVRSATSIVSYVGGEPITDADGFYPTGDLGDMTSQGLVIVGRKSDLVNVAGRKFMLNDLDQILFDVIPEARGRAVACAAFDAALGTETPLFLAESAALHFDPVEVNAYRRQLADGSGIASAQFAFVPPGFITKTSSGKANRQACAENYRAARAWQRESKRFGAIDLESEIRGHFGDSLPFDAPADEVLDSLGLVNLRLIAEASGRRLNDGMSIDQLLASVAAETTVAAAQGEHIRIVCLAEARLFNGVDEAFVRSLSDRIGVPISYEHLCLPPSRVLLNDLKFHDWFLPRGMRTDFDVAADMLAKVKAADVIIVDDIAEYGFPQGQAYPQFNNRFQRSEEADLLCYRWQQYTRRHHLLPVDVIIGADLPADRNPSLDALARETRASLFRVATLRCFEDVTRHWECVHRIHASYKDAVEGQGFVAARFADWIDANLPRLSRSPGIVEPSAKAIDLAHFCCWLIDREKLQAVLDRYERFCIVGAPSSLPFVPRYLAARGKSFTFANDLRLDAAFGRGAFDCVLQTGSWGRPETDAPVYQIFGAGHADGERRQKFFASAKIVGS